MKFSDLKLETQLHIITELSQLETSTHNHPFVTSRHDIEKVNISDVRREELQKHDLSLKCLTNSTNPLRIVFTFDGDTANYPNVGAYLDFSNINPNTRDIYVKFGGSSHIDGLTSDTPIKSTINNAMTLSDQRTLRDSLEIIWRYTNRQRTLDEVSNIIPKLIEAYDVAMTLPEDLLDFINSWIPSKVIMSHIASNIQHSANQYLDDGGEEYATTGYDSYVIRNIHHECGIEVAHAFNSTTYNNYRLTISHTKNGSISEDVLSVHVSFGGKDRILLKEAQIAPDLTLAETIDFFTDMIESVREIEEWNFKCGDLIDHLHENIVEVKPFILNALAG